MMPPRATGLLCATLVLAATLGLWMRSSRAENGRLPGSRPERVVPVRRPLALLFEDAERTIRARAAIGAEASRRLQTATRTDAEVVEAANAVRGLHIQPVPAMKGIYLWRSESPVRALRVYPVAEALVVAARTAALPLLWEWYATETFEFKRVKMRRFLQRPELGSFARDYARGVAIDADPALRQLCLEFLDEAPADDGSQR